MYIPLQDAATVARSEAVSPGFGPSHSQHNEAEEGTLLSISFMSGGSNRHSQLAHGELNETLCSEVLTCRLLPKLFMYIPLVIIISVRSPQQIHTCQYHMVVHLLLFFSMIVVQYMYMKLTDTYYTCI